jgi:hypothetical protein
MSEVQILLWMTGIHLVGFIAVGILMMPMLRDEDHPTDEEPGSSDDGWGNLPGNGPVPKGLPGGGLPLPDAVQSKVRLREPGRLADRVRTRERRPIREPVRTPSRRPVPAHAPGKRQL